MRNRLIAASAVVAILVLVGEIASASQIEKIIVISVDTLRADFLGCYNPKMRTSPNLDQFASENVIFLNDTAQSATTASSHKSIFYSVYPSIHKTTLQTIALEKLKSPIEMIRENGFATAAFTGGGQVSEIFGFERGFKSFRAASGNNPKKDLQQTKQLTLDWLEKHHTQKFFLFVHTYEAHCPYNPPAEFFQKWSAWYAGRIDREKCVAPFVTSQIQRSEIDYEYIRSLYSAEVNYIDEFLGELFHNLKDLGVYDETLIVFLSDHGESLGERGYVGHTQLYNIQLRVPLIMHIPGITTKRISAPVESLDVMPTIFELIGIKNSSYGFQGKSLISLIHSPAIYDKERARISEEAGRVRVQVGDFAVIFKRDKNDDAELYNVKSDPEEVENIAEQNPDIVKMLKSAHSQMISKSGTLSARFVLKPLNNPTVSRETIERLKALGYIAE